MSEQIDISKMDKAEVLVRLYNRAKPQGLGFLSATTEAMNAAEAQKILDGGQTYFDYLQGRVMKVDLAEDHMRTDLYNRDNGTDAAQAALVDLLG
jgi:hypothetical protein